jgi:hypothetical protein
MKSIMSLVLAVALLTSALPLNAQGWGEPTTGPIARAVMREGTRLATGVPGTAHPTKDAGWSHTLRLAPGTEIDVTVRGGQATRRYFVSADDSSVTVLNVSDPALPGSVAQVLRDTASIHPEHFLDMQSEMYLLEKGVRLTSEGVFVTDHKVVSLEQILETIARKNVDEIARPNTLSRSWAARHPAAIGALVGFAIGSLMGGAGSSYTPGTGGCDCPLWPAAGVGFAGIGAAVGAIEGRHTLAVIYRAP